jgi:uncharacterized protein YutE (UPF0331/DUF86 family)
MLQDLEYLRKIQILPKEDFLNNFETKMATRYSAQELGQAAIDIAFHICAFNKFHEPTKYREAFVILAENNILPNDLATKLANWAGLRNLLIHFYGDVDDSQLYDIIQNDLEIFDQFIKIISEFDSGE